MSTRRSFLAGPAGAGLLAAALREDTLARAAGAEKDVGRSPPGELAGDEDYRGEFSAASKPIGPSSISTAAGSAPPRLMSWTG